MSDFNEIINSDRPTLVDFFAVWCNPCKMMSPVIDQMVKEIGEDANI